MSLLLLLLLLCLLAGVMASIGSGLGSDGGYIGSAECGKCHPQQFATQSRKRPCRGAVPGEQSSAREILLVLARVEAGTRDTYLSSRISRTGFCSGVRLSDPAEHGVADRVGVRSREPRSHVRE